MTDKGDIEYTEGSANALSDLGFEDAEEVSTKVQIAVRINEIIEKRHLKQIDAANLLGIRQPKISALKHYHLDGFSVERLFVLLTKLDRDVEIVVRKKPKSRSRARVVVAAA